MHAGTFENFYILEFVLEREPGSGSIQFSAYGCIAPTRRLTCVSSVNDVRQFKRIIIYIIPLINFVMPCAAQKFYFNGEKWNKRRASSAGLVSTLGVFRCSTYI